MIGLDIMTAPWATTPEKFKEITGVYRKLKGGTINFNGVDTPQGYEIKDGVAIIDIQNIITKRLNFLSIFFGGTSSLAVSERFKEALDNPEVRVILFYIDSPGGSVGGTAELANLIYESRGQKPVIAFTDGMMVSAAYWIGSAADKVYISGDTTQTGSIGIVATHIDISKAEEMIGIKTTEIAAGRYKRTASEYKPLSDEGKTDIQEKVDYVYSVFVSDIAKFRGVSVEKVLSDMADGKIFIGTQAMNAGLVDGVSTFDGLISRLAGGVSVNSLSSMSDVSMKAKIKPVDREALKEQLIQEYEKEHEVSYRDAVLAVSREHPELFK